MFPERIVHEQISIDADKSEEKNTGIEVGVKYVSVAYTQHIPVWPLSLGILSHQHGKGTQKCQVTDREVEEVDVTAAPVLQAEEVAENDGRIRKDSHDKLNAIQNGKVAAFQGSLRGLPVFTRCIPFLKKGEKT